MAGARPERSGAGLRKALGLVCLLGACVRVCVCAAASRWLARQPHRRQWDRWVLMGLIGVTTGLVAHMLYLVRAATRRAWPRAAIAWAGAAASSVGAHSATSRG